VATCTDFINDIFLNPVQGGGSPVIGDCSITTNQRNGVVSYAAGSIAYSRRTSTHPPRWTSVAGVWRNSFPAVHLPYYFSDRTGSGGGPFSASNFDNLGLEIALLGNNDQLGVTLTLRSWGNAQFQVNVMGCDAGVLYGVGAGIGAAIPEAVYTIWVGRVRAGGFL